MQLETLLWQVDGEGVGLLTFNRPQKLNALNGQLLGELGQVLDEVERGGRVRALVATGAGDKAFVAGADIAEMSTMSPLDARRLAETAHGLLDRLERLPIVTVAAINGFALGGGCELAMGFDLVYASERARMGQPEVNLGLVPGFGGSQRLTRRVGLMRAKEMVLTGDHYDAARCKAMGLVLEVLAPDQLVPHAVAQARKIAGKGPVAVALAKRIMQAGADLNLAAANELERQSFAGLFATADAKEGMRAFVEKRTAAWSGK